MNQIVCLAWLLSVLAQPPTGLERIGRVISASGEVAGPETQVDPPDPRGDFDWDAMPWDEVGHRQHLMRLMYDLSEEQSHRLTESHYDRESLKRKLEPPAVTYRKTRNEVFSAQAVRAKEMSDAAMALAKRPVDADTLAGRTLAAVLLRHAYLTSEDMTEHHRRLITHRFSIEDAQADGRTDERAAGRAKEREAARARLEAELAATMASIEETIKSIDEGRGPPATARRADAVDRIALADGVIDEQRQRIASSLTFIEKRMAAQQADSLRPGDKADAYARNRQVRDMWQASQAELDAVRAVSSRFEPASVGVDTLEDWAAAYETTVALVVQLGLYRGLDVKGRIELEHAAAQVAVLEPKFDALIAERDHRADPGRNLAPQPRPHADLKDRTLESRIDGMARTLAPFRDIVFRLEAQVPFAEAQLESTETARAAARAHLRSLVEPSGHSDPTLVQQLAAGELRRRILFDALLPRKNAAILDDWLAVRRATEVAADDRASHERGIEAGEYRRDTRRRYAGRVDEMARVLDRIAGGKVDADVGALQRLLAYVELFSDAEKYHSEQRLHVTHLAVGDYLLKGSPLTLREYIDQNVDNHVVDFFDPHGEVLYKAWPRAVEAVEGK